MSKFQDKRVCGVCKSEVNVKRCSRCQIANYCSQECQKQDLPEHKNDCKTVVFMDNFLAHAEYRFEEVPMMDMCMSESRSYIRDNPNFKLEKPESVTPADFLVLKKRKVEAAWRIICRHQCYKSVKDLLFELLEILRFDACEPHQAADMVPFMMLYAGEIQDAYNFLRFRMWVWPSCSMETPEQGDFLRFEDDQELFKPIEEITGEAGEFEDVVEEDPLVNKTAMMTAVLAVKIKVTEELKKLKAFKDATGSYFDGTPHIYRKIFNYFTDLEPSTVTQQLKPEMDGEQGALEAKIEFQDRIIEKWMKDIMNWNKFMLQALVNPKPILDLPLPNVITPGKASEAADIVRYAWPFFHQVPGAKQYLIDFLTANKIKELAWPEMTNDPNLNKNYREYEAY